MNLWQRIKYVATGKDIIDETTVTTSPILRSFFNLEILGRNKVLAIPQVTSDVDLITSTFALVPIKLYKETYENGTKKVEEVRNDERVKYLNAETNDTLDAYQFKKAMCEDYLLMSGGYAYIDKTGNKVNGLYYVKNENVSIFEYDNFDPIKKRYMISVNGSMYEPFYFIKMLRNTRDGMRGEGVIEQINEALDAAYSMMKFQLNMMKKGGNKKGFLQASRRLGREETDYLKRAWNTLYSDQDSDSVAVLNEGITFKESSNTAVEMQLVESIKTLNDEIDRIFHIEKDYTQFIKNAILPICTAFVTALNRDLLLESEKGKFYFDFDLSGILKASVKERYDAYKSAKDAGWITGNEIRAMENLPRAEGLDVVSMGLGDVLLDVKTGETYTPNTGQTHTTGEDQNDDDEMEGGDSE